MALSSFAAIPALLSCASSSPPSSSSSSSSSSHSRKSTLSIFAFFYRQLHFHQTVSPFHSHAERPCNFGRRDLLSLSTVFPFLRIAFPDSSLALLEGDDDEDLLNKAKLDRQKRLQRREILSSFKKETASVQNAVYNLSKVGEALEASDYSTASGILGTPSQDAAWIVQLKDALLKVSENKDEKLEADEFTSSLSSLQTAVSKQETDSSRSSFVASASALERWSLLTGLFEQIKGL